MAKRETSKPTANERPRGGRTRQLAEIVPEVGRAAFRRFGFVQSSIVSRWGEIVGERYATLSAPESIRFSQGKRSDGVLTLVVAGAHAPMFQHIVPVVIERVNRFFGYAAVARVVIRQGELPAPRVTPPRPNFTVVPTELGESLRTIADPELKAVLESLARGVAAAAALPTVAGKIS